MACPSPYVKGKRFFIVVRGPVPRDLHRQEWRFRSFRTYMSIAARVVPFSRSFRSLMKTRAALAKSIKDLKDLSILRGCACYRHSGPTDLKRTRDVFSLARAMARGTLSHARVACEGPRPTVKGAAAAAPVGAPPYCIETRRSLLRGIACIETRRSLLQASIETRRSLLRGIACIETGRSLLRGRLKNELTNSQIPAKLTDKKLERNFS